MECRDSSSTPAERTSGVERQRLTSPGASAAIASSRPPHERYPPSQPALKPGSPNLRHNLLGEHFPNAVSIVDDHAHDERIHLGLLSGRC
jgi:hypothetical protein